MEHNMKKISLAIALAIAFAMTAHAQQFTIVSTRGAVEIETSINVWRAARVGDSLRGDAVVRTGADSTLTLRRGDETFVIGSMRIGMIVDILHDDEINKIGMGRRIKCIISRLRPA
jgi:hypothetical protein